MKKKATPGSKGPPEQIRSKAYSYIQRKIASGELAAGAVISELALAKELGSSRTPVREAMGQLASEGFLDQTPHRGAVIARLNRHDVVELYELREALETFAVVKAARGPIRGSDVDRLHGVIEEMSALAAELKASGKDELAAHQMHRFMSSDLAFHTLLMRMADNSRILKVVNETRLFIRIFAIRHRGHRLLELQQIERQHRDVLEAVVGLNPEFARKLLSDHIQTSQKERLNEFDYWECEDSLRRTMPEFFPAPRSGGDERL